MNSTNLRYLMNLPKFDYFEPKTIEEACSLLYNYKDDAMVLAGGTDLSFNEGAGNKPKVFN